MGRANNVTDSSYLNMLIHSVIDFMGRFPKRTNQINNETDALFMGRFNVTNKLKKETKFFSNPASPKRQIFLR